MHTHTYKVIPQLIQDAKKPRKQLPPPPHPPKNKQERKEDLNIKHKEFKQINKNVHETKNKKEAEVIPKKFTGRFTVRTLTT